MLTCLLYPETKRGCYTRGINENSGENEKPAGFTRKVSSECEISPRTAQRLIQMANEIDDEVSCRIKHYSIANKQTELIRLSQFNAQTQTAVAKLLVEKNLSSISEAIERLAESRPDFLENSKAKELPNKLTAKRKNNSKIIRVARVLTSLVIEFGSFQNDECSETLNSVALPKQKIEEWLKKMLALVNPEPGSRHYQKDKVTLKSKAGNDENFVNNLKRCPTSVYINEFSTSKLFLNGIAV